MVGYGALELHLLTVIPELLLLLLRLNLHRHQERFINSLSTSILVLELTLCHLLGLLHVTILLFPDDSVMSHGVTRDCHVLLFFFVFDGFWNLAVGGSHLLVQIVVLIFVEHSRPLDNSHEFQRLVLCFHRQALLQHSLKMVVGADE